MLIKTLNDVQTFLNQKFGDQINWGTFALSGNERVRILTYNGRSPRLDPAMRSMKIVARNLPNGLGLYERKNRFYFAPTMTAQNRLDFAEVEAWVIGTELVELTEQKLALMGEYGEKLKNMVEAKKVAEMTN